MKFFTTEWYNDTIVAEMYSQLRKTQKAAEFSDKFYEKLRKIENKAFLRYYKRIARFSRQKFDAVAAQKQFDSNYEENLAFIKANLPAEILENVKDVRVLALGSAEYSVVAQIERFCGQMNRKCKAVESQYDEQLEKVAEITGWEVVNSLDLLVGSPIESITENDGSIVITTSPELVGASYTAELVCASKVSQPESTLGALITKHELTTDDGGMSFGLLCLDENSEPITVEFAAQNISIRKN